MKEELLEKRKKISVTEAGVDWGAEKTRGEGGLARAPGKWTPRQVFHR